MEMFKDKINAVILKTRVAPLFKELKKNLIRIGLGETTTIVYEDLDNNVNISCL